jgi:hypothetical protein
MKKSGLVFSFIFTLSYLGLSQEITYTSQTGVASFKSDAPLEIIKAESKTLVGRINPTTKEFSFVLNINSFQGFNSAVQRVHFLEDYLEETKFPVATFKGKLIEDIPFDKPGTYEVRAKGTLEVHGVQKERIIRGTITIVPSDIHLTTNFLIPLSDHDIAIPKIVRQKIAEQIAVTIDIAFSKVSKS